MKKEIPFANSYEKQAFKETLLREKESLEKRLAEINETLRGMKRVEMKEQGFRPATEEEMRKFGEKPEK